MTADLDTMAAAAHARIAARGYAIFSAAPSLSVESNGTVTLDNNTMLRHVHGEPDAADTDVLILTAALRTERAAREATEARIDGIIRALSMVDSVAIDAANYNRFPGYVSPTPAQIHDEYVRRTAGFVQKLAMRVREKMVALNEQERLHTATTARALGAECDRDTALARADALDARLSALAAAVREERAAGAAAWAALSVTDRERDRAMNAPRHAPVEFDRAPLEAARVAESLAQVAHVAATARLDALLRGAPADVVQAQVVRAYLAAREAVPDNFDADYAGADERARVYALWDAADTARTALDAALAAAGCGR